MREIPFFTSSDGKRMLKTNRNLRAYIFPNTTKSKLVFARKKLKKPKKPRKIAIFGHIRPRARFFSANFFFAQIRRKMSTLRRFYDDIAPIIRIKKKTSQNSRKISTFCGFYVDLAPNISFFTA